MSHATTTVTPHCHLPGRLWNKTDLDDSVWRSGISSPVLSPPCHQNERDIFMDSIVTGLRLRRAEEAEKINSRVFSRECGSLGSPKVKMIWGFFCLFAIFSAERRHYYMDAVNRWVKQRMGQEQDTVWSCYRDKDEPQKLHNFLISSLPDTWLNSVVRWAALTSTFCMICKTDFL